MSTAPLIHTLPNQIAEIGRLVKQARTKQRLSLAEFAARVSYELGRPIDLTRIAKIEEAANHRPAEGYAKAIKDDEVIAISKVIRVPAEILNGISERGWITFDPTMEPDRARAFLDLMQFAESHCQELLRWGARLPCSLETPRFLEAHTAGIFRDISDPDFFAKVTAFYNRIGSARREHFLRPRDSRV